MRKEKIKDLYFFHPKTKIQAGEGKESGEFPFYTSSEKLSQRINQAAFNNRGIVIGTGGKASIHFADGRYSVSTDCYVLGSKQEKVNIKYAYYYLAGNIHILEKGFQGAGLRHISKKYIEKIEIPYPELSIQNKIVAVLEKASLLAQKRDYIYLLLDEFLRAVFYDLFGDPVINPKKWPLENIEKATFLIKDGPFGSNLKTEHYVKSGIRVIRLQNIGVNKFINEDEKYISKKHFKSLVSHTCVPGDILVGTLGEPNLRACKFPTYLDKAINKADCVQIKPNLLIANDAYLTYLLNLPAALYFVSNFLKGQTRTRISKGMLAKIDIPIPPLKLQGNFAKIETAIDSIRAKVGKININSLFKTIHQKAYNGELRFNIDLELDTLILNEDKNSIQNDIVFLQRIIDRLKGHEFKSMDIYDKSKGILFDILKEQKNVKQEYDKEHKNLNIIIE